MIGRQPFFPFRTRREPPVPKEVETARGRLLIAGGLAAAAFAVVAVRLVDVTMMPAGDARKIVRTPSVTEHRVGRADIVDRNGRLLATNLATASLYANPRMIPDAGSAAARLSALLPGLDMARLTGRLEGDRSFLWVKRHLTPQQKYAVNRLGIPGLDFKNEERRLYPSGALAGHVLGFTDIDNQGLAGIERKFDDDLAKGGKPMQLSIDIRVQHIMRDTLRRSVRKFSGIGGAGVVLDARNGEVVAMVSLPEFNPNDAGGADDQARFNRATLGVYEMGSTFKIFTTAMALDAGKVTLQGGYDATDPIRVGRFVIRDYHAKKRWLSVPEIFMYSSNIGSVKMALDVGRQGQRAFLQKLGMLDKTPVELDEIGAPITPRPWRDVNAMTISFGHGMAVSPMQLVAGVAAMVNGGILYPPTLFRRAETPVGRRVISEKTSEQVRRLLRLVVSQGTGRKAAAKGYLVGGKTGTAEKVVGRSYKQKALMSSFVAAFPMNAPRYVVFAMVDEPTGTKETFGYATGGWVAAPVVGEVISRIGPLLGVKPVNDEDPAIRDQMAIRIMTMKSGKKRLASF